jgi:hypothetical protein
MHLNSRQPMRTIGTPTFIMKLRITFHLQRALRRPIVVTNKPTHGLPPSSVRAHPNRPEGSAALSPEPGGSFRRSGVGFPVEPSPRNHRDMTHHDQDSSVTKNVLGPLSSKQYLTGTIECHAPEYIKRVGPIGNVQVHRGDVNVCIRDRGCGQ